MSLESVLEQANNIHKEITILLNEYEVKNILCHKLIAGYLSLAHEHYLSIVILIEHDKIGSASALARPLFEAMYRGTWLTFYCTDKIAEEVNSGKYKFSQIWSLADDIDSKIGGNTFYTVQERNINILHDYTHGGMRQISRRFSDEGYIENAFSADEIIDLLNSSNMQILMMTLSFFVGVDDAEKARKARKLLLDNS